MPKVTRSQTIFLIAFAYGMGILISVCSSFVFHCCSMFLDYKSMTFGYIVSSPNQIVDADNFLDLPINSICFSISILCYIRIYWFVKSSNLKVITNLSKSHAENRKAQETKYAFQFAACTGCAILICILYHILPFFLPSGIERAFIAYSFLEIIHSSANALIFVIFNSEIRRKLMLPFGTKTGSSGIPSLHNTSPIVAIS